MFKAALSFAFLLIAVPAYADTMTLAKHYNVVGKNPDGSKYSGSADVTVISDTTFSIIWHVAGGTTKGFGMRMNDSLSATYMLDGEPGLVIYQARPDGALGGLWAIRGQDGSGSEVLTPGK